MLMKACHQLPQSKAQLVAELAMLVLPSGCSCREFVARIDCLESILDRVQYPGSRIGLLETVAENNSNKEQEGQRCQCW
jgi:hypothetical protein